jgi:glycosyltransferase involved in cell wall biosynthesis
MRESHIFVLPSIEDGSALVTYDAQACGCVLVVSQAAGARCEHMHHGLVHRPGDVQEMTEHIRLLDRDRELLARMRSATLAHLEAVSWEHAAKELVGIYRDCLAPNGG